MSFTANVSAKAKSVRVYPLFVVAYLLTAVALFMANPDPLQSMRLIVFDTYQRLAPAPAAEGDPVQIVAIDEVSLAQLGQWPWPRSTLARLTDELNKLGARAIVFDVLFAEPDRTSPEQMLGWLPPERSAALRGVIEDWPTHDGQFADSISDSPAVLAATLQTRNAPDLFPLKTGVVLAGGNPASRLPQFAGYSDNVPALTEAARGLGFMNWLPDRDQVVRRVPLLAAQGESVVPSLALEALRVGEGQSTYVVRSSRGPRASVNEIRIGERALPTNQQGEGWLHYRRADPDALIPAWDVLDGQVAGAQIEGRIVIIGATAPGLLDLRATPLDAAIPGAEIHRQLIEQMLDGRFLTRPEIAPAIELLVAIFATLLLGATAPRFTAATSALLGAGTLLAIFAVSWLAFTSAGYLFDPVYPAACAFLFATLSAVYLYRRTEVQRAEVRRAFNQYVAPSVVKQLTAHPERLALGGEVRELTLLFCDVRNFTGISESLNAEQLTTFINSLLTPLSDIIIERGGTIDKYMGDAIMAFWNAPLDDPEHARHAIEAAERIALVMHDLNQIWRAEANAQRRPFTDVAIGIGVNSGECCVGNLGSHRRFDYSAIGDNVNITARLEGLTKVYGLALVVGEDTVKRLPEIAFLELDCVRVKGRAAPTRLFTLLSLVQIDTSASEEFARRHKALLAAFRAGEWQAATAALAWLRERAPAALGGLYAVYEVRLAAFVASPPENWDGVFEMERK